MTIKIQVTFETITPESAEDGDFADHGFAQPGGWKHSIADERYNAREEEIGRDAALQEQTPEPEEFEDTDEAIRFLERYSPFEPSCYPLPKDPNQLEHVWLTQTDASQDRDYFEKGEETRYSFHIDEATPTQRMEILKHFAR